MMGRPMHFVLGLFHSLFVVSMAQNMILSNTFYTDPDNNKLCDVTERVDRGCSTRISNTRSRVDCVSMCVGDMSCVGASLDESGQCYHHRECPYISGCTTEHIDHDYVIKHCAHGSWDPYSQSCKCVDGFFGPRCKQCHTSCRDLITAGYEKGVYRVYIDPDQNGQKPFVVNCFINPQTNYVNVHIMNNSGEQDFNKTWNEYVIGFNHWAGLYPLHRLSHAGLNVLVFCFFFPSRGDAVVYRSFYNFNVASDANNYRLSTGGSSSQSSGNIPTGSYFGDCLGPLEDAPFSTWDRNHDLNVDENCASNSGSGWWYKGCDVTCNVLGFGLPYWDIKPRKQIFTLLGVDMSAIQPELGKFHAYLL